MRLAEELGAEIVSLDSMLLYRGMDIGTAKPTPEERARVPHHLVDVGLGEAALAAQALDDAVEAAARGHGFHYPSGVSHSRRWIAPVPVQRGERGSPSPVHCALAAPPVKLWPN